MPDHLSPAHKPLQIVCSCGATVWESDLRMPLPTGMLRATGIWITVEREKAPGVILDLRCPMCGLEILFVESK